MFCLKFFFWSSRYSPRFTNYELSLLHRKAESSGFITWRLSPRPPRSPFALQASEDSWADSRRSNPSSADPRRRRSNPDWDCFYSVTSVHANHRLPGALAPCYFATSCADFGTKSSPVNTIVYPLCSEARSLNCLNMIEDISCFVGTLSNFLLFFI